MANPANEKNITANGAAKYISPPAIICKIIIVPPAAPCASRSLFMLNGELIGLNVSGSVKACAFAAHSRDSSTDANNILTMCFFMV